MDDPIIKSNFSKLSLCAGIVVLVLLASAIEGIDFGWYTHLPSIVGTIIPSIIALVLTARRVGYPEAARILAALPLQLGIAMVSIGVISILQELGAADWGAWGSGFATIFVSLIFSSLLSVIFLIVASSGSKPR